MWGEVYRPCTRQRRLRITPACAGRSPRIRFRTPALRDHPRVCGEKRRAGSGRAGRIGSLPRVRGEVHDDRWRNGNERITPACAGRSNCILRLNAICEDHPRVRGEKSSVRVKNRSKSGSPPRVRGEAEKVENCRYDGGITPACAGRRTRFLLLRS